MFLKAKSLFFPDLGTVINIKRKQWIPTSAGVSFILNCSPPACWEYYSCLLFGKFQESYLYPLCEGLLCWVHIPLCVTTVLCQLGHWGSQTPASFPRPKPKDSKSLHTSRYSHLPLLRTWKTAFHSVDILFPSIGKHFFSLISTTPAAGPALDCCS